VPCIAHSIFVLHLPAGQVHCTRSQAEVTGKKLKLKHFVLFSDEVQNQLWEFRQTCYHPLQRVKAKRGIKRAKRQSKDIGEPQDRLPLAVALKRIK